MNHSIERLKRQSLIQAEIRKKAEQAVRDGVICGYSLGFVTQDNQQFFYYGTLGAVPPYCYQEVRDGLYYDLASLTKVVGTTTRILQMAEKKSLDMGAGISDLLPAFCYPGITVEHLLLHCSGLPAEIRHKDIWNEENLPKLLYDTKPQRKPGECFIYSDVGFILLGKVIEALDHKDLETSFQEHIFGPLSLRMRHTSYLTDKSRLNYVPTECTKERGCICGEVHDKKARLLGPCGSAGLFSTLRDITRFTRLYLEESGLLFGKETFSMIRNKTLYGRTLGWSCEYGQGTLYHTGFTGTSILINYNQGSGMVLLTNRIHPTRDNEEFLRRRKEWNRIFLEGQGC